MCVVNPTYSLVSTSMTIITGSVTYCDIHSRSISMDMPMDLILGGGGLIFNACE